MKNAQYDTRNVKHTCENKLGIAFRTGGKEYNGWFLLDGRKTARITVAKGKKFIPPKTYGQMARQLKLQVRDFDGLLDCPITREHYERILRTHL